ncbi:MAG: YggT family protein [Candidatus Gracilibacteria bacterium]
MTFLLTIIILLEIISYIVIFDVILSWLTLLGLKFRPKFIADIIDPLYINVKKYIPTSIGPLDFTPIVIILLLMFIKIVLFYAFPGLQIEFNSLIN